MAIFSCKVRSHPTGCALEVHETLWMAATAANKRVLFLIGSMGIGGAERVFLTLLRHLDRSHFQPHLAVLQADGELFDQLPQDVAVHVLKGVRHPRSVLGFLLLMYRLVPLLWKIRPHSVLSTGGMNLALVLASPLLPRGTKLLVRECSVLSVRLSSETKYPRLWRWLYRRLYQLADHVVCQSDSMVRDMIEELDLPQQSPVRIYNPIDIDLVREWGKSGGTPYSGAGPHLVAAGRLTYEKGFDLLLAAMPKVIAAFPNAQLTILGEGTLQAALSEQGRELGLAGSVSFVGFQQNPWPYLCHAQLFVLPSRREAFGNALLEALALETQAVAADCPGAIREIYAGNPAVELVPAGDAGRLAEAIVGRCKAVVSERTKTRMSPEWLAKFSLQRILGEYNALLR